MQKFLIIIISSLLLSGCTLKNPLVKKPAGLQVNTSSVATVYLGDQSLGSTPVSKNDLSPGEYTLRLVPIDTTLAPYEAKLELSNGASAVVNRTFAPTLVGSFGYTLNLIPDPSGQTTLSVVSDPDTSNLTIDNIPSGFTPLSKKELAPGDHQLIVSTPGYSEQTIPIVAARGYNLLVNLKLKSEPITLTLAEPTTASSSSNQESDLPKEPISSPEPTLEIDKPYVTVSSSPDVVAAGGLNVRREPSSSSDSLGKAAIGEHLKYLGETTTAGWHKIEFEDSVGYVSAKYATLTQ